jgi:hypothetical protein
MKLIWKYFILVLAFLPFLYWFPVLVLNWGDNPENIKDPVFMAAALFLCAILVWRRYKEAVSTDLQGGIVLAVPSCAALIYGWLTGVPMFLYPGAILFGWSVLWIVFGWRMFYRLFPIPLLMMLSLPTTDFLTVFPGINFTWKVAIGCALCIYAVFALMTDFNPIRRRTAWFSAAVIAYALLYAAIPV